MLVLHGFSSMESNNRIARTEFTRLPKHVHPEPDIDWASVDFVAGPHQIAVVGFVRFGPSGGLDHDLSLCDVKLESDDEVRLESGNSHEKLHVEMCVTKEEHELTLAVVRTGVHYRVLVEFTDKIPNEYSISHIDENGDTQFEVFEAVMDDPYEYQEEEDYQ